MRSLPSVNVTEMIDSAAGVTIAAPSPWTPRAAINIPDEVESPQTSDATAEERKAAHEDDPPPDQVGRAPAEEQEPAVREAVGGDDPLEVLLREAEVCPGSSAARR